MTAANPNSILIVGAGIAGIMAGRRLRQEGWKVTPIDKGRGLGGRMANRRIDDARIDHGAQFFTIRSPRLQNDLQSWLKSGHARLWYVPEGNSNHGETGTRYVGDPAMTAVPKLLARELDVVRGQRIERVSFIGKQWTATGEGGDTFSAAWLLLTPPVPQSLALLNNNELIPPRHQTLLQAITYDKCIAVMATLSGPSGLPAPGIYRTVTPEPLALLVDNQQKGISTSPAITLHSGPGFAEDYFDSPDEEKIEALLAAAKPYLTATPVTAQAHRWGYAKPRSTFPENHYYLKEKNLIMAGDAFGGGRIEGAALSGLAAADRLLGLEGSPTRPPAPE